ncbi:MAG TPA: sigma-70 family RNA polymerase sigma factor [Actinomycetota bacterium]|nr:sigma-70 family RNA polymerase sigma factor [Actinomycetota bacterium]
MNLPPFQALLDRHGEDVRRFVAALVGPEEGEDCAQETFLAALRAYPSLRNGTNLRSWLLTIAHRKAMDEHRARKRRPRTTDAPPDGPAPEREEHDPAIWLAVRRLPVGQREAVALRFVADLPYREIAAIAGCTEAAARQRVREAIATLRKEWR